MTFNNYENSYMKIEERQSLKESELNNLIIFDKLYDIKYEVNCKSTLEDVINFNNLKEGGFYSVMDNMTSKNFLSDLKSCENQNIFVEVMAESKDFESILESLPQSEFSYTDIYNNSTYFYDGYDMKYSTSYGSVVVNCIGFITCDFSDNVRSYMYDEFFEELLKFNNVMVEKGFISNFSASIEDEKNLYIEKFVSFVIIIHSLNIEKIKNNEIVNKNVLIVKKCNSIKFIIKFIISPYFLKY